MSGPQQFWESVNGATSAPAPESTTVTHVYRFPADEFARRLGIVIPDGARVTLVEWHPNFTDDIGSTRSNVKITVENRLERKPS